MSDHVVHSPDFEVTAGAVGNVCEVCLTGELDIAAAPQLRGVLAGLGETKVVVDVTHLRFIDCAGVSALALAMKRHDVPGDFTLRGANGVVRRVIEAVGFGELLSSSSRSRDSSAPTP